MAYEMRISAWSSDVCSSDLSPPNLRKYTARLSRSNTCISAPSKMSGVVVYKMALSNDCVWLVRQGFPEKVQCRPPAPTQRSEVLGMSMMPSTGLPWCKIGRASCRERVCQYVYLSVVAVSLKKKFTIFFLFYFSLFY